MIVISCTIGEFVRNRVAFVHFNGSGCDQGFSYSHHHWRNTGFVGSRTWNSPGPGKLYLNLSSCLLRSLRECRYVCTVVIVNSYSIYSYRYSTVEKRFNDVD